jgi:microcin C transport system permease protein
MIERLFSNELARKRWRRFSANKVALFSAGLLLVLIFFSMTAELWANSKPIVMSYRGVTYFPVVKYYHPTTFDRDDIAYGRSFRGTPTSEIRLSPSFPRRRVDRI